MISDQDKMISDQDKMISAQDLGRYFEDKVHLTLCKSLNDSIYVLREKDVKKNFGSNNSSIDHCLISNDYIICIQDKWESKSASISKINHFLMGINNLSKLKPNLRCIGIYLSKLTVSGPSLEALSINDIKCVNISGGNMEGIIEYLLSYIHKYGFYTYEDDGSIIMR